MFQSTRSLARLLAQHHVAGAAADASASLKLLPGTTAAYSKIPGPTPVQSTGGGDRPSTNDDTRDLSRYGSMDPNSSGPAAIELETEEMARSAAGENIYTPHTSAEQETPDWKASSSTDSSGQQNDPRATIPTDDNRRWMSSDDLGTRLTEATDAAVTPRWPKPGLADELGSPRRAGAPMDPTTSVDKPHATATTSQFGGDPTRDEPIPDEEYKQGHAIPNEAAANQ